MIYKLARALCGFLLQNSEPRPQKGAREEKDHTQTDVALGNSALINPTVEARGRGPAGLATLVTALAGFALVVSDAGWHAPVQVQPLGLGFLALLAVCAVNFPLPATPGRRVDTSVSVYFAFLLLYGSPVAAVVVAACALLGHGILAIRAARLGTSLIQGLADAIYSAALMMLAVAAAGAVYFSVIPQASPAPLTQSANFWLLPLAAAVMFAVISLGRGLQAGRAGRPGPIRLALSGQPGALLEPVVLYATGVLIAVATYRYPWASIAMAAPIALVYSSLRRTIGGLLLEQAVSAVEALADVVDMRDAYTFHHSQRVAEYSARIATEMGMRREQVDEIRLAGRVHDLGKIGVPDRILLKAGRLSSTERELMERHPELGYEILSRFPEYVRGRHLVLSHHERPDGLGYPHKLVGSEIPLGALVIAVADALDAMTSSRPYRLALSLDEAMATFAAGVGTQWHPGAVSALQRIVQRHGFSLGLLGEAPARLSSDLDQLERQEAARRWLDQQTSSSQGGVPSARAGRSHATIRMPAAR